MKYLFILLIFSLNFLYATPLTNTNNKLENFTIFFLNDDYSLLSIHDVSTTNFTHEIPSQFALGYNTGTAWFKITLNNQSEKNDFILYFTEPFWTNLDLYTQENGHWIHTKNGLAVNLKDRSINDVSPSFALHLNEGETKTYYIKGETVSSFIGEFQVYTKEAFYQSHRISLTDFYLFYSGIMLFILLLVSFLFSIIRDKIYIYYIAYVFSFIVWISTVASTYLLVGLPAWYEGLHATGTLVVLFLAMFSSSFLELKEKAPKIYKIFKAFALVSILFTISITLKVPYADLFFNLYASVFFTTLLVVSLKAVQENYVENTKFYLIALLIYMPGMGLMTLTFNGLVPNNDFTRYLYIVGSFTEIVFFSYILVTRYNQNRNQKLRYQKELLHEKSKTEIYLEAAIVERTQELQEMNKQLQFQTKELEETKEQLIIEASTDALSKLYNRRYFMEVSKPIIETAKRYTQDLSLFMIDIDNFKNVNDTYGHEVGDRAIVSCSNTLKIIARYSDIVTRYGGEEFIILLPQTSLEDGLRLAERVREAINKTPIKASDTQNISISISIGVTQLNHEEDTLIGDLIQRADKALYLAKDAGRDTVKSLR